MTVQQMDQLWSSTDQFGVSVTSIGDLNNDGVTDLAVGAWNDDGNGDDRGAVHILFMNSDGSVDSTVEINDSTANGPTLSNGDNFGYSLENIGDLDNDGVTDLAVGAWYDDHGGVGSGANYGAVHILFMNSDGSVKSTAEINSSTANGPTLSEDDNFGSAIADIGDVNRDGVTDLAVGAHQDDNGGSGRGAIHILFMNSDGSVDSTVEINDSTANGPTLSNFDRFGRSITDIGDINGDSITDIVVGALQDDNGGSNRGAVHIIFLDAESREPDSITVSKTGHATLSETLSLSDDTSRIVGVNITESISFTDSTVRTAGINLSENLVLSDRTAKNTTVILEEIFGFV